ncbi:DNA repair exonuclease [Lactobacillus sp. ESL0684]|uniref:metallophosphoesterase family protein n=1 Tax=Lactobacillus sp. ESL0684 TaxID=2983213 RepID=UPI0023F7F1D0|nr:DNA repair exonuclease [Lactobacillus sp. ESL0684]WEV44211.1 DNA repair exonuclease [Lactobacillus sp. ESL0684]
MKFIHLADAHLDSPFLGLSFLPSEQFSQIRQAPNESLTKIVDLALAEQVDLVLIAGDTFDSARPDPSSQLFFAQEISRLTAAEIQVVMIFGNHDHMQESDLLIPDSPYFKLLGNREQVETITCQTKTGFNYAVNGFSYLNNHITTDMLEQFPAKSSQYTFGLMHAQEKAGQSNQNVYAPFRSSDLKNLNYDYFALGHIHLRQVLSENPLIVYSGNIQGRHINELGAKGCYLGEINEATRQTSITFVPTSPITWEQTKIELSSEVSLNDLQEQILAKLHPQVATYYSLKIIGADFLTDAQRELMQDSGFWQQISQQLTANSQLVDVRFVTTEHLEIAESDRPYFEQAKTELFTDQEFAELAKDWLKKDDYAAQLAEDPQFKQEVQQLTEVELNRRLKGIEHETD